MYFLVGILYCNWLFLRVASIVHSVAFMSILDCKLLLLFFFIRSRPSSGWQSHILVWGVSGCTVIGLIISQVIKIGPGK